MAVAGRILVYGGKGALGSVCVNHFKAKNYVSMFGILIHMVSVPDCGCYVVLRQKKATKQKNVFFACFNIT